VKCVSPPELDEMRLWTYVDGEADQETVHHLEKCEYCRGRADELAKLRNRVGSRLYRINCPSTLELGEYHLGLLEGSEKLVVAQHIRECQHCQGEIAHLEEFLKAQDSQPDVLQSAKVLIATLVGGGGTNREQTGPSLSPALSGLRGDEDEPFTYQAGNVQIVIDVQDDVEQTGHKTLLGLVTGLESNDCNVQVSKEGETIATASVDEVGNFIVPHLLPGNYQLALKSQEVEIHIKSLLV